MAGGYLSGLNHEDAAKFSFLTATPIILGATVLEAPKLLKHGDRLQPRRHRRRGGGRAWWPSPPPRS